MENYPTHIDVVAAAISTGNGLWLMQKRPLEKHHGGLWEFPGGKVEPGENPENALVRELEEELGILVERDSLRQVCVAEGAGQEGGPGIVITLYTSGRWQGQPQALEGGKIDWFTPSVIGTLDRPPLDILLTEQFFSRDRPRGG